MPTRTLEQLSDIEDIKQLKARYCRLIDQKKWAELEADFTADAAIEIAGAPGGAEDTQKFTSAHAFVEGLEKLMGPLVSVHQVHAPEIELIDATQARGTFTISDRLVFPDGGPLKILHGWGIYHETYVKAAGQWRTASLRLERLLVEPTEAAAPPDARAVAGQLLAAIGAHDLDGLAALFAEEVDWFVPGSSALPWTGRRTHGSQAADFFAVMWPYYLADRSTAEIHEIMSDGSSAVVLGSFSHVVRDTGRAFTTPVALHIKVEGGKITHLQLYEDTLLITQSFGSADAAPAVGFNDIPKSLAGRAENR